MIAAISLDKVIVAFTNSLTDISLNEQNVGGK